MSVAEKFSGAEEASDKAPPPEQLVAEIEHADAPGTEART